ncbi:WD40 repeat-like protein [Trametes versicolor FP-101664 SS1]|uniref:WD40 repeat-like protein n=1 Tax=Trametes versicolor (strain FP-101664) TaxID=717944 RepID=UPI00046243BF|nr:WD40 repeat-like protein [Trametes versicolor FP-101664 SS1]EIW59179.1 WD40 repeat-like protein [Trametes versicolor FP-101664 SS1]
MSVYRRFGHNLPHKSGINAAAFGPDATFVVTATADGGVYIWRAEDGALICSAAGDTSVLSIAWTEIEDTFVYGTASGNVANCSFSSEDNTLHIVGFLAHNAPVNCISVRGCLVVSGAGSEVRVWKWRDDGPWDLVKDVSIPGAATVGRPRTEILVTAVGWANVAEEGPMLVASYLHHGVFLFASESLTCTRFISTGGMTVGASISDDGRLISLTTLAVGFDIYSLATGNRLRRLAYDGETRAIPSRFLHSDAQLVCGGEGGKAHVWDVMTGNKLQSLPHLAHDKVVVVDFARDRKLGRTLIITGVSDELNPYAALWIKEESEAPNVEPAQSVRYSTPALHLNFADHVPLKDPPSRLLREVSRLRAALTLKTHQAHGLAVVVNNHILNYDYYRDRCRELEDELVRRFGTVDPDALRIVMPLRFPD